MKEDHDNIEETIQSFGELGISNKYSFDSNLIKIVDVTIHTVRQAWVILRHTLPYELENFLRYDSYFPDFDEMYRFIKFSSLAYISIYSVATIVCEVTKPDPGPPSPLLSHFRKSKSKSKADNSCVVIIAISVLNNHTGIGLSIKLLDHTINKIKEANMKKVYALADENSEFTVEFYTRRGFQRSNTKFDNLISNLKVECSKSPAPPSFFIMEMAITNASSK